MKINSILGNFKGKSYTYKTKSDLKEGQVIKVPTRSGILKACVTHTNIDVNTIEFPLENILEV